MKQRYSKIVGISNFQNNIRFCKEGDSLKLVREPNNQFDKNAIAVYTLDNKQLGYLSKSINEYLIRDLEQNKEFGVSIESITGENFSNKGCNILIYENTPKDIYLCDGFIQFRVNGKFVHFKKNNEIITLTANDFKKAIEHFKTNTRD